MCPGQVKPLASPAGLVLWLKILFRSKLHEVHVWPYFKSKVRGLGLLACLPCLLNPAVFIQSAAAAPVRRLPAAFPCFSLCKDSQCKGDCVRFHSPVARLVGAPVGEVVRRAFRTPAGSRIPHADSHPPISPASLPGGYGTGRLHRTQGICSSCITNLREGSSACPIGVTSQLYNAASTFRAAPKPLASSWHLTISEPILESFRPFSLASLAASSSKLKHRMPSELAPIAPEIRTAL